MKQFKLLSLILLSILIISCSNGITTSDTIELDNEYVSEFIDGEIKVFIVSGEACSDININDYASQLWVLVDDPSAKELYFSYPSISKLAPCHGHWFVLIDGYPKFLTIHRVGVTRPDGYMDSYDCYVYSYAYKCAWCGDSGGTFITHSVPHL